MSFEARPGAGGAKGDEMSAQGFGQIDQTPVFEVTIASKAGASAKILTWGAVVRDLVVPASNGLQRVVLGLNTLDDYLAYSPSFGATPGRFANRIANGRFVLDGVAYQLDRKPGQKHTLHGGPHGFGGRIWKLGAYDESSVELMLESPDGDAGFPGNLTATCVYRLLEPSTLRVELSAVSDRPTIVNLTQHSYFNLDGSPDILDHELRLFADFYTPADEELIPTGEIRAVAGTPYDFRTPRTIRNPALTAYDTNFVASLLPDTEGGLAQIAALRSPKNGLTMSLFSTEPGVQFYSAAPLNCPAPGLDGQHYGAHAGLALEPQAFPDSPNRRHFTDCVLRPDEEYQHVSEFRFA
jgi:aldose 1-epimerase